AGRTQGYQRDPVDLPEPMLLRHLFNKNQITVFPFDQPNIRSTKHHASRNGSSSKDFHEVLVNVQPILSR
ncbi:MAG TPA: hypothetical protein VIF86_08005, partial [Methylobacter sp.]